MKTQRQSPRLALRLSATRWCRLGFQVEDDSQDHVERGAEQILQIDDAADCAGSMDLSCMKCDKGVQSQNITHFCQKVDDCLHSAAAFTFWASMPESLEPCSATQRASLLAGALKSFRSATRLQRQAIKILHVSRANWFVLRLQH